MSKERAKGTRFESQVVAYLMSRVIRAVRTGSADAGIGDILLPQFPMLTLECKDTQRIDLPGTFRQAEAAATKKQAGVGPLRAVAIHKQRRKNTAEAYVTMTLSTFTELLTGDYRG